MIEIFDNKISKEVNIFSVSFKDSKSESNELANNIEQSFKQLSYSMKVGVL